MQNDFMLEKKLRQLNKDYHTRVSNTGFLVNFALEKYKIIFPEYTDHSVSHSLRVIEICNMLVGKENLEKLNADEIYTLLMSAYLHDSGMGISEEDYQSLKEEIISGEYLKNHPDMEDKDFIRSFHQEFSGGFIKKHQILLDIPSPEHVDAIIAVSRGHRINDLYSETEYPAKFKMPNGNTVCLPYLASLIRLADELDIGRARNSILEYELGNNIHKRMHYTITSFDITEDTFVYDIEKSDEELFKLAKEFMNKLQKTIDYCVDVIEKRTNFTMNQKTIKLNIIEK